MSLYYVQKFLYELNRSETAQAAYRADGYAALAGYELTDEEIEALTRPDIGRLFHLGVNGQILMHFAAFHQIDWQDYLQRMRDGIAEHGPVREGVYAMTTGIDEVVAPVHTRDRGQTPNAGSHRDRGQTPNADPRNTARTPTAGEVD